MSAYYNENDPKAAAWLRELIKRGLIAPGDVDDRSIGLVRPDDLRGYRQRHFFAGIGVWSYALRQAGWEDDRPVWTGSCPCQPFSLAGKKEGLKDKRHLWPEWFRLIAECRPDTIFGEQVASALSWLDLVSADLEGAGYAFGSPDLCAAGFSGAHIRQRLYWVADANDPERWADLARGDVFHWPQTGRIESHGQSGAGFPGGGLADADGGNAGAEWQQRGGEQRQLSQDGGPLEDEGVEHASSHGRLEWGSEPSGRSLVSRRSDDWMGDTEDADGRSEQQEAGAGRWSGGPGGDGEMVGLGDAGRHGSHQDAGDDGEVRRLPEEEHQPEFSPAVSGGSGAADGMVDPRGERLSDAELGIVRREGWWTQGRAAEQSGGPSWARVDWLFCRDGAWRPVEPGSSPLVVKAPARMGRLRGYGNALDAETAKSFIAAFMEAKEEANGQT